MAFILLFFLWLLKDILVTLLKTHSLNLLKMMRLTTRKIIMDISGVGAMTAPQAWSGASPAMPPGQKMASLFDKIDANGSGSITQSQFQQAFQSMSPPANVKSVGMDNLFKLLDPNGTGQVSKSDFVSKMTDILSQIRAGQVPTGTSTISSVSQSLTSSLNALNSLGQDNDGDSDQSSTRGVLGSSINTKA